MQLPKEAKKLLTRELQNLTALRKKIRRYMLGGVAGSALQIFQIKRELEEYLTKEFLHSKILTRQERLETLQKALKIAVSIPDATEDDVLSASLVATSFSGAWASAQVAGVPFNWDSRLRRIVATETARSYSDVVDEVSERLHMSRKWVSVLDAKTCPFCKSMDGEETQPGETFKNGHEPGYVHVSCRCYSILIIK